MARCDVVSNAYYRNITLKNIVINNPKMSPGVILGGNGDNRDGSGRRSARVHPRIDGLVLDNVVVTFDPPMVTDPMMVFPGLHHATQDDPYIRQGIILMISVLSILVLLLVGWCWFASPFRHTTMERDNEAEQERIREGNRSTETSLSFPRSTDRTHSLHQDETVDDKQHYRQIDQCDGEGSNPKSDVDDNGVDTTPLTPLLQNYTDEPEGDESPRTSEDVGRVDIDSTSSLLNILKTENVSSFCRVACRLIAFSVPILLTFLFLYWLAIRARTHRFTEYFACSGVSDGIVRGATFPVPSCFQDESRGNEKIAELNVLLL